MQELLKLAGKEDIQFLIKRIFIRSLPNSVLMAIGNEAKLKPIELAELAEKHWLNNRSGEPGQAATVSNVDKAPTKKEKTECKYHKQYGEKARKCHPKCPRFQDFKAKKAANRKAASVAEAVLRDEDSAEAWDPMLAASKNV